MEFLRIFGRRNLASSPRIHAEAVGLKMFVEPTNQKHPVLFKPCIVHTLSQSSSIPPLPSPTLTLPPPQPEPQQSPPPPPQSQSTSSTHLPPLPPLTPEIISSLLPPPSREIWVPSDSQSSVQIPRGSSFSELILSHEGNLCTHGRSPSTTFSPHLSLSRSVSSPSPLLQPSPTTTVEEAMSSPPTQETSVDTSSLASSSSSPTPSFFPHSTHPSKNLTRHSYIRREFPPPLPPTPWVLRKNREGGRLIIRKVMVREQSTFFRAETSGGNFELAQQVDEYACSNETDDDSIPSSANTDEHGMG